MRMLAVCVVATLTIGCGDSGTGRYGGERAEAKRVESTRQTLERLSESLEQFKKDKGRYPTAAEDLKELRKITPDGNKKWSKPYTSMNYFVDSWGIKLYYTPIANTGFELKSAGPDARLDTADDIVVKR